MEKDSNKVNQSILNEQVSSTTDFIKNSEKQSEASANSDQNNPTNKNILKKITIVVSTIVAFIGFGSGAFFIISALGEPDEVLGAFANFWVYLGGLVVLVYTGIIILVIWLIYGLIKLVGKLLSK